ncbi:MAG: NAD(P)/FAD-dependent oxidoreductase [Rhodobacteraceae bacterium]|nr:NAD(P)/FAD-dependent oxidoreductase [Paracoccaceae bacterium]
MTARSVIVIGGGTNGLACAHRLATAGRRVTVLEAAPAMGGGAAAAEFHPGHVAPALAHLVTGLDPRVSAAMALARHGLALSAPLPTTVLAADGAHRTIAAEGGGASGPDAAAWAALHRRLAAHARALAPFRLLPPPRLSRPAPGEALTLARLALGLRRTGREAFRDLLRLLLINVADVAEDELSDDLLRGALAFDATLGSRLGPRSPNSLILYLDRLAAGGTAHWPQGGMASVAQAMTRACAAAGVTLRTGARVRRITVTGDRAAGVELASGEMLAADLVVSAIGPRSTFRSLVGPAPLDAGFFRDAGHIRSRGAAAKLHLALTGMPDFRGADPRARLLVAPSVDAVETAFNPVKYGEVPDRPVMEIVLPSAHEPGHAPEGRHTLSAILQYAPHDPPDREAARARMLAGALAVLEDHAPGLGALVAHAELLMPWDIEDRFGMEGGNWHHGELAVERMLFLRPLPDCARYSTPLPGLWLAGAGSHPGGGITGTPGWNAAARIIETGA